MATVNLNSIKECKEAYIYNMQVGNYLTQAQVDEIEEKWGYYTDAWKKEVLGQSKDQVNYDYEYNYDSSNFDDAKEAGREAGENATQFDGEVWDEHLRAGGNFTVAGTGAVVNMATGGIKDGWNALGNLKDRLFGDKPRHIRNTNNKLKEAPTDWENFKNGKGSIYVAAAMNIATAAQYYIDKPNEDAKNACDALQSEFNASQSMLTANQDEMEELKEEMEYQREEAELMNEDANYRIEEEKTLHDIAKSAIDAIQAKIDSGQRLSDSEKELYKASKERMINSGTNINSISSTNTEEVGAIYSKLGENQENLDDIATGIYEVDGLTDYASDFDQETQISCYTEAATQGLNVVSSLMTVGKLLANALFKPWEWAIVAAVGIAGTASGVAAKEQWDFAGQVGNEIKLRKDTEDLTKTTEKDLESTTKDFNKNLEKIEGLEMKIPKDIEAPPELDIPEENPVPDVLRPQDTNDSESNEKKKKTE